MARRSDWVQFVNRPQTQTEIELLRQSVNRGRPFGAEAWQQKTAEQLGLESTFRKQGRPKKLS